LLIAYDYVLEILLFSGSTGALINNGKMLWGESFSLLLSVYGVKANSLGIAVGSISLDGLLLLRPCCSL
jgi:hypothetical protein